MTSNSTFFLFVINNGKMARLRCVVLEGVAEFCYFRFFMFLVSVFSRFLSIKW